MPEFTGRLRTPRLPSAPSSPVVGEMYFDTGTNVLYWWNGTTWISASGAGADLIYNGDFPANTPYTDGDVVIYNGIAYMCVTPTAAAPVAWPGGPTPAPTPKPAYGTTLPASPIDGQEAVLVDSITNPTYQWRFRYNAGSSSAYKWEFIGGTSAMSGVTAAEGTSSGSYVALTTAGPSFTVPRAGDYEVAFGSIIQCNQDALSQGNHSFDVAAVSVASDSWSAQFVTNRALDRASVTFEGRFYNIGSGGALVSKYKSGTTNSHTFSNRWMRVIPLRVS